MLVSVLVVCAAAHAQPADESLPAPARTRRFEGLSVTLSDIRHKTSTITVTAGGAVTVDGRKGELAAAERAALQSAFEAYDDSYGLTDGRAPGEASVKLTQPEESWYVPPVSLALEVRTKASRHKSSFTLPQLDRLDAKRVEHALVRALLDVRSRVLLQGVSATLTVSRPGALPTTTTAEIARVTSDGLLIVETRTTHKKRGKMRTDVYPTSQRLASPEEVDALRASAAKVNGEEPPKTAVVRLADGTLRAADETLAAILELERHGGPPLLSDSKGLAKTLEDKAAR